MRKKLTLDQLIKEKVGCMGEFQMNNPVCKRHCILSIRCAIEHEQNEKMEIYEDLICCDNEIITFQ